MNKAKNNKPNRAFIFPGQGSQAVGMGKEFYDNFPIAKQTFEEVNDSLNMDLAKTLRWKAPHLTPFLALPTGC